MAKFSAKTEEMKGAARDLDKSTRAFEVIHEDIAAIKNNLGFQVAGSANIKSRLLIVAGKVEKEAQKSDDMAKALERIADKYIRGEKKVVGELETTMEKIGNFLKENGYDFLSEAGPLGTFGSIFMKLLTGKVEGYKDLAEILVGGTKALEETFAFIMKDKKGKFWESMKELVGIHKGFSFQHVSSGFLNRMRTAGKAFGKEIMEKVGECKKLKKFAKSSILGGLISFADNYDEHGEINKRMLVETGLEFGMETGKSVLLSAGVVAACAAAGVSAPAVVVGGVAVGASMILDWTFKEVTGADKGIVEAASDFVSPVVERGINSVAGWFNRMTDNLKFDFSF